MAHANGRTRPGACKQLHGTRSGAGRRRWQRVKAYHFDRRVLGDGASMTDARFGTNRHCYVHPDRHAIALELNTQDKSYRRPICQECL